MPLKENRGLSSVFADHRDFHFHSGIDFKTGGKTGLEVRAVKSGWAYRLVASWWGYGKVVYLRHPDGKLTVYAHLSDFSEKLKKVVTQKQLQNKNYKVDIFLEDTLWIEQGEVIGYSGQTGSGAPHLHFEIRDEKNKPINPLSHGFPVKDTLAPILQSIAIRPRDFNSRVDDSRDYRIYSLHFDSKKQAYILGESPAIEGRIGIEVSGYDQLMQRGNRFSIYRLGLFLDTLLIFSSRYDTIDFENSWKVELDRDFELSQKKRGEFHKLYIEKGNDLPLYYSLNKGILELKDNNVHQLIILAADVSGNVSKAEITLQISKKPLLSEMAIRRGQSGSVVEGKVRDSGQILKVTVEASSPDKISWKDLSGYECESNLNGFRIQLGDLGQKPKVLRVKVIDGSGVESDYVYLLHNLDRVERESDQRVIYPAVKYSLEDSFWVFKISFDHILKNFPEVFLKAGEMSVLPLTSRQIDEKSYEFIFPFFELYLPGVILDIRATDVFGNEVGGVRYLEMFVAKEDNSILVENIDGSARVQMDSGSVFKNINLTIEKTEKPQEENNRLKTPLYSFNPSTYPLAKPARVSISYRGIGCEPSKTGLYESTGESYRFIGQDIDTLHNLISGKVRNLSAYALLEDLEPPTIKRVYPKSNQKISGKNLVVSAWVKDDLSGIGSEQDIEVLLDGEWQIPEYDPETYLLISEPLKTLSPGWHQLVMKAKDRMGNEKVVTNKFKVIE